MYPVIQYTFIYTYCYDFWKINVLIKPYDSQNCKSFAEAIFLVIKYKTLMSLVKFVSGELRCFVEYLVCRMLGWYSRDCRVTWPARGGWDNPLLCTRISESRMLYLYSLLLLSHLAVAATLTRWLALIIELTQSLYTDWNTCSWRSYTIFRLKVNETRCNNLMLIFKIVF